MCGISGFYNINKQQIPERFLRTFMELQHHRGPDAKGSFYQDYIGLAHNRLSLLDLSETGNQPFVTNDYVLVYNGEIYNYLEVRKELPALEINSTSDTAVLFEALKTWGIDKTLEKIKGMFAFAWFNRKTDELILARDRVGIKPLFYAINQGTFCFSSELKAILSTNNHTINPVRVLYSTLGNLEKSNSITAWEDIFHVPPGSYVVINEKGHKEVEYFEITNLVNEQEFNRLSQTKSREVIEEFDNLMLRAVQSCLIADAPVGAFVSGGIDSSLIASYCSEEADDFKMFTANVVGKHSEVEFARLLAQELDRPLFESKYTPELAVEDLVEATWHYESPMVVHFNAIPFRRVASLARERGVKAVLTGEGSDELFLGYPRLLTRRYNALIRFPYTILDTLYGKNKSLKKYLDGGVSGIEKMFVVGAQGFERQIKREDTIGAYSFLPKKAQKEYYLSAQMMKEGIVSLLWRNDRMGMAHSIESRFPFLDEEILKFSMNLPIKYKIGVTRHFHNYKHPFLTDKFIVRKVGEKRLSSKLTSKKKKGFPIVGLRNFRTQKDFFKNGFVENIMGINNKQFEYMIDKYPAYFIGKFTALEVWGQLFVLNQSKEYVKDLVRNHVTINY